MTSGRIRVNTSRSARPFATISGPIPAGSPIVVHIHGLERTKDRLLTLISNAVPDLAPMLKGPVDEFFKSGFDGRQLKGLPKEIDAVEGPRWVSAKSVFAFQALMPTAYTNLALQRIGKAQSPAGWGSGVYEESGESTANLNINTAAVILSAALMDQRGEPLLADARRAAATTEK